MEKSFESEKIYEINSEEWFLGRMLGMPQSQIQKSLEKTKPQHIAANHSLQMIDNLEKKLSELRGEIYQTMQKGPEEDERYNPVNDMPTGIAYGKEGNPIRFPVGHNNGMGPRLDPDYPEDPRYPPENWNNDQDPRARGEKIGAGVGREIPSARREPPPSPPYGRSVPSSPPPYGRLEPSPPPAQPPQTPPDEDADGPLGGSPRDVGSYHDPDADAKATTAQDYGKYSNESARRYGPPSMPTAPASGNRGPFPEIADAARTAVNTGIKRVGNAVNTGLKTAATVKNTISGGLNEIKNDMTGNSVGKSYRLLEDDGHVLRRGLTAENYEMIKGLAVVLRISETEVLHRLEKNGVL